MTKGTRVVGYIRVSTAEQAASGAGLEAQRAAIQREADAKGWELLEIIEDGGYSAKDLRRPGVQRVLAMVDGGEAQGLIVAKLDRLSRSLLDFAGVIQQAKRNGWSLVALDIGLDTTTANGRMMAGIVAVVAEWERELIGQRTRDALAVKRAQGVTLGRPRMMPPELVTRMRRMRKRGASYSAIAATFNAEAIPTAQKAGARWHASTVRKSILSL